MMVYIVIFDRKAYQISSKLFADINAYIDDRYVEEHRDSYAERISRLHSLAVEESCPIPAAPMVTKAASLDDALKQIDESFSEMLLRKIDECGMTDAECYKKANIDRKLFSKIRTDKLYIIFKQKTADRVDSYFERLILWIAEDFRGDQRECDRLATMLLCERE